MYVHIDPETLDRHPWIAIALGSAGCALFGFLSLGMWGEIRRLGDRTEPERIAAEAALARTDRAWVHVTGGLWDCAATVVREHGVPDRWLFGPVDHTEIPVRAGRRLLVVKHPGEASCAALAASGVEGLLVDEGDRLWGGRVARALRDQPHDGALRVLVAGGGPGKARMNAALGTGLFVVSAGFTALYALKWARRRAARTPPPSAFRNEPIDPD